MPTSDQRSLKWTGEQSSDVLKITFMGDMDENANLHELHPILAGKVNFDLEGVRRINSAGVREWVNFIRDAGGLTDHLTLVNCSPPIVMQMNMIANFRGTAEVSSLFVPMVCPECDREQDELIELVPEIMALLPAELPRFICRQCGAVLELDDIPERYFAFLKL